MSAPITIISPELPPVVGGLSDYTAHFVRHWPRHDGVQFIVPGGQHSLPALHGYPVIGTDSSREALLAALPRQAGKVLLQYSAYGFHRYGYPQWLIDALIEWKQKSGGRLCVMFHEIWTFWPWWNKNFVVQTLHRRAVGRLARVADAVLTTTESQAQHIATVSGRSDVAVLPVGANILPDEQVIEVACSRGTAVLFGMEAARCKALRLMHAGLSSLARTGRLTAIRTFGAGGTPQGKAEEHRLLRDLNLTNGFEQLGIIAAADATTILVAAEFGIAAQDRLSYSKSTTFMAYAAHGLKVLSDYADSVAPEPMSLLSLPEEVARGLPETELAHRATKLREWYRRTASWPRIAVEFARALEIKTP